MPRIDNAHHLHLSDVVNQFATYSVLDTREVRSNGPNFYVKEQRAPLTAPVSRTNHRRKAIALLRGNFEEEFGTTKEEARQILSNVFGHAPTRITVNDIILLCDLGKIAKPLIAKGESAVNAFDNAIQEYGHHDDSDVQDTGIPLTLSGSRSETMEVRSDKFSETPEEKTGHSDKSIEVPGKEALTTDSVVTTPALPASTGSPIADETPMSLAEAIDVLDTARALLADFPPYESSYPEHKEAWLFFAQKLGAPDLFPTELLQDLPIAYKISLQMALADHLLQLRQHAATIPEQTAIARIIFSLNKAYTASDLISRENKTTLDAILAEAGKNQILRNAYANWKDMDITQRGEAIRTLMDIHAEKFGYADHKAELIFKYTEAPNIWGSTSIEGITINANNANFGNFREVCNTIIHESTHWYQLELIARAYSGQIDAGSPSCHPAFLLCAASLGGIDFDYISQTLGLPRTEAFAAYEDTPDERQASLWSNYVSTKIPETFDPRPPLERAMASTRWRICNRRDLASLGQAGDIVIVVPDHGAINRARKSPDTEKGPH